MHPIIKASFWIVLIIICLTVILIPLRKFKLIEPMNKTPMEAKRFGHEQLRAIL